MRRYTVFMLRAVMRDRRLDLTVFDRQGFDSQEAGEAWSKVRADVERGRREDVPLVRDGEKIILGEWVMHVGTWERWNELRVLREGYEYCVKTIIKNIRESG